MSSIKMLRIFIIVIIITLDNSNANGCLDQLKLIGLDENNNSRNAFQHIYENIDISSLNINVENNVKIIEYINDLWQEAISVYQNNNCLNPKAWCMRNIVVQKTNKNYRCHEMLRNAGFDLSEDTTSALKHAYNYLTTSKNINEVAKSYYIYMQQNILPLLEFSVALGPTYYCEENTDCIGQIIRNGQFNVTFNGTEAFEYAYLKLNSFIANGKNKDILYQYFEYLYYNYTTISANGMFKYPKEWCDENKTDFIFLVNDFDMNWFCEKYLVPAELNEFNDSKSITNYLYHTLNENFEMNNVVKRYFIYVLENIQKHYAFSGALGPVAFCNNFNETYGNTPEDVLNNLIAATQPVYFRSEFASSEGETTHATTNQYNIFQTQQQYAESHLGQNSSANEEAISPSLFMFPPY